MPELARAAGVIERRVGGGCWAADARSTAETNPSTTSALPARAARKRRQGWFLMTKWATPPAAPGNAPSRQGRSAGRRAGGADRAQAERAQGAAGDSVDEDEQAPP